MAQPDANVPAADPAAPPNGPEAADKVPHVVPHDLDGTTPATHGPKKRLCLFLDGTWNNAIRSKDRLGLTNIWRLSRAAHHVNTEDGVQVINLLYYCEGLGSDVPGVLEYIEGATGLGLSQKIRTIYSFVVSNWCPGDEIVIFGFSRGAYTARTVAALICELGVLSRKQMEKWPEVFYHYQKLNHKNKEVRERAEAFLKPWRDNPRPSREKQPFLVNFLGVFDTVGSMGLPGFFAKPGALNFLGFSDLYLSGRIQHARHAMAINENRNDFLATRFIRNPKEKPPLGQTLRQCWFAGNHSDIGGGWPEPDLSYISLFWMIEECQSVTPLRFDIEYLLKTMATHAPYAQLPIHDSITQSGFINVLEIDVVRRIRPGNDELVHCSVLEHPMEKWPVDAVAHKIVDCEVVERRGVEQILYDRWDSLPHCEWTSPKFTSRKVKFKARMHDIMFWAAPRNVSPPAAWSRKKKLDSNDEEQVSEQVVDDDDEKK